MSEAKQETKDLQYYADLLTKKDIQFVTHKNKSLHAEKKTVSGSGFQIELQLDIEPSEGGLKGYCYGSGTSIGDVEPEVAIDAFISAGATFCDKTDY